ncbi:MAG: class I SAM-dependent methyltransferase [Defluviitaleaceae bacterium]|nr:class I SAM-dependent methyltransferase [Defluviitaleaceae bacterium]
MIKETEEKLARSLTAETTDLLPFLPYLLQDLWELGSDPREIIKLIKDHIPLSDDTKILDLACGKGAVSIRIAESLGVNVYGVDLISEFIEYADKKAKELDVGSLCHFSCGDANEPIGVGTDYDCVVFGAAGNVLGSPQETLQKLIKTVKPGGCVIIVESYLPNDSNNNEIKYKNYEYLTHAQWLSLFKDNGLMLLEELSSTEEYDFDSDTNAIALRADELIAKHPDKRAIFEGYVNSQRHESEDLESSLTSVTWMLKKY